jgi:hypothetical protein
MGRCGATLSNSRPLCLFYASSGIVRLLVIRSGVFYGWTRWQGVVVEVRFLGGDAVTGDVSSLAASGCVFFLTQPRHSLLYRLSRDVATTKAPWDQVSSPVLLGLV